MQMFRRAFALVMVIWILFAIGGFFFCALTGSDYYSAFFAQSIIIPVIAWLMLMLATLGQKKDARISKYEYKVRHIDEQDTVKDEESGEIFVKLLLQDTVTKEIELKEVSKKNIDIEEIKIGDVVKDVGGIFVKNPESNENSETDS